MTLHAPRKKPLLLAALFLLVCAGTVLYYFYKPLAEPVSNNASPTLPDIEAATLEHQAASLPQGAVAEEKPEPLPAISPAMAAEIRQLTAPSPVESVQHINKDGSVSTVMQTHSHSVTAAALGPDGKMIIRHGEDFLNNVQETSTK